MFSVYNINDTVRVPPKLLGGKLKNSVLKILQEEYEGLLDEDIGIVIAVFEVQNVGEGKIVPGDGSVYYATNAKMLVYKPELQEVVEGNVSEITEFGAFVKTGPIEALVHVSQVMDDFINFDSKNQIFVGKDSGKKLAINDIIFARIVTISLKGSVSNSKIGLTRRQIGLGKKEWKEIDKKSKEKKDKLSKKETKKEEKKKWKLRKLAGSVEK